MRKSIELTVPNEPLSETAALVFQIGRVVEILPGGRLVVDYDGNAIGPLVARCIQRDSTAGDYQAGSEVLLAFENQDALRPIVLGAVSENCRSEIRTGAFRTEGVRARAIIDGERIALRGDREIVLECGLSSLVLQRDGKIVLKGVEIVSRASGNHKIRGATVKIN
jgi:hypothetical protein